MKFYPKYEQKDFSEVERLMKSQSICHLQTLSSDDEIQTGVYNPIYQDGFIFLHLNRSDEQVKSVKTNGKANVVFLNELAVFPSYWADKEYAGAATAYYQFANIKCSVEIIDDSEKMIPYLDMMMDHFQPEGNFDKIEYANPIYTKKLDSITILKLKVESFKAKWKLGQNRPVELRREFIENFRKRNRPKDRECAQEIERWIERNA